MAADDFVLAPEELRAVARFAASCASRVLPDFEAVAPHDSRPREALDAARVFAEGAPRSNRQRTAAFAAHRAAREAPDERARLAALACGDAAAAAYLHPIARASQVGHILRAAACAAIVHESRPGAEPGSEVRALIALAGQSVPAILRRYPPAPEGRTRLAQVMGEIDAALRSGAGAPPTDGASGA
ncbi:putative immunity protein [Leucobacter chromiiresistens]|uniref:Imm-5-like domain-containing protein n=1 Tax=Leucobacter chromiiresistens TaxID=1079994 RepID=A0A1H1A2C9_9MICO|nr:hypothetical protein [Leucobacter chromiiresistens]SDQ33864.1 hypothetical protein SAMN04488565_2282 [Leucobacter chromiiresistens]